MSFSSLSLFGMLRVGSRTSCMLGKFLVTELQPASLLCTLSQVGLGDSVCKSEDWSWHANTNVWWAWRACL